MNNLNRGFHSAIHTPLQGRMVTGLNTV